MEVKKAAGTAAYQFLIDIFNNSNKGDVGQGLKQFQLKHVCDCLRIFHAITVQLKCNDFHKKYKVCISASYPLGSVGLKWRSHHKLDFIGKGYMCTKKAPEPYAAVISHCQSSKDIFHRAISKYVQYCSMHLPDVTTIELQDMGEGVYEIIDKSTYKPPEIYNTLHPQGSMFAAEEDELDYGCSEDDVDTSDTEAVTDRSNEHDSSLNDSALHSADNASICHMDVDDEGAGLDAKDIEPAASRECVKPAEFVTTQDSHTMAHHSPIIESAAGDVVDDVMTSPITHNPGHIQKYPRQTGQRSIGNHGHCSSTNGWEQPHKQSMNGWGEPIKK